MIFKLPNHGTSDGQVLSMRCPACGQLGTFAPLAGLKDAHHNTVGRFGHRRCPNPQCHAHVFVVLDHKDPTHIRVSYPAQRLDFDSTDIPAPIVSSLEEAITCHANRCFRASAIMIRKSLEELCDDQAAAGGDLRSRLDALKTKALLPDELIDGLHDLRLLGNDAAHLQLKTFDGISEDAVALAIDITKEVLKRVYQSKSLVERLRAFKKT